MITTIHIGPHKTATTSIQKYLEDNKDKLKADKIYIPDSIVGIPLYNHWPLNVYSLDPERYSCMKYNLLFSRRIPLIKKIFNNIKESIREHYLKAKQEKCKRVIWSNEGLSFINSEREYNKLTDLFREYSKKIEVVFCIRNREEWARSFIQQMGGLDGGKITFERKNDSYYLGKDSYHFDIERRKMLFSKCFDKAIIFNYDKNDNVKSFLEATKIKIYSNTSTFKENNTREKFNILTFNRINYD